MITTLTQQQTRFPLVSYSEATAEVKSVYDDAMITLQVPFVLNWLKCQGSNGTLLKGNWAKLKNTLIEGEVPNLLKQLIIYNVSSKRNCSYCAQAHGIFADAMGAELNSQPGWQITKNMDSDYLPDSYKTAILIVTEAALQNGQISDQQFDALLTAGFTNAEVQELLAQADLVNMLNTIATISGIQLDEELTAVA